MRQVTKDQLLAALQVLGIQPGDGLLVHAAIQFLGRPEGGVELYSQTLFAAGVETLAVPAFTFAFARGEAYDPQTSPSQGMGALAEHVRLRPEARRTPHPLQSLAVVGRWADDLAGRDTASAFDPGSAFERLLELDFKLLLLGADIQAVSMVHYSEGRANVPYRYWKEFSGPVRTPAGWETRTYRMFARDLELNPLLDLHPIQAELQARGAWRSVPLNYGSLSLCRLRDFTASADRLLADDPWALVGNRAEVLKAFSRRGG